MTEDTCPNCGEETEHYTAPQPDFVEEDWEDPPSPSNPKRVLWVKGYGFDEEVFAKTVIEINEMFQDTKSWVVAEEPDMEPEEAFEKALLISEDELEEE